MTNLGRIIPLFKGTYNSGTTYSFLDVVVYNGSSYVAKQQTSGNLPTNTTYWVIVAKAGSWSTFTAAEKAELIAQIESDLAFDTKVAQIDAQNGYYICDNSHNATITINIPNYTLKVGGSIKLKMVHPEFYFTTDKTLNISGTGAKPLYYEGAKVDRNNSWQKGEIVTVFYDGENYQAFNLKNVDKFHYEDALFYLKDGVTIELDGSLDRVQPFMFYANSGDTYTFTITCPQVPSNYVAVEVHGENGRITTGALVIRNAEGVTTKTADYTINDNVWWGISLYNPTAAELNGVKVNIKKKSLPAKLQEPLNEMQSQIDTLSTNANKNDLVCARVDNLSPININGGTAAANAIKERLNLFIREIYLFDGLNIDYSTLKVKSVARARNGNIWYIYIGGKISGATAETTILLSAIPSEETSIIPLMARDKTPWYHAGYIYVNWDALENGFANGNYFNLPLIAERCKIEYCPTIANYILSNYIGYEEREITNDVNELHSSQYLNVNGELTPSTSYYQVKEYDVTGLVGLAKCYASTTINAAQAVCKVVDANGNILNTMQPVTVSQYQNVYLDGTATKLYLNGTTNNNSTVFYIQSNIEELGVRLDKVERQVEKIAPSGTEAEIIMPTTIHAVVGDTLQIFYHNICNVQNLNNYEITAVCDKGKAYPRYWEYTPTAEDIGETSLTISICKVNDVETIQPTPITTKVVQVVTVPKLTTSPQSNIHILACGASVTANGQWPWELNRRLTAMDGTPTGDGLSNITFVGRKRGSAKNIPLEATGGWAWYTFVDGLIRCYRFYVTNVQSLNLTATYTDGSAVYTIEEINVTNGTGEVMVSYNGTPSLSASGGTLTKASGNGDATLTYTSFVDEHFSPFRDEDGNMDFTSYINTYCGGYLDWMVNTLGINSIFGDIDGSGIARQIAKAKEFLDPLHQQSPNTKVLLFTWPKCSLNGGLAANYNASITANLHAHNRKVFKLNKAYQDLANDPQYKDWLFVVPTSAEFDSQNNYPYNNAPVNTRNTEVTEKVGTNGVHPSLSGLQQMADTVYRELTAKLQGL